MKKIPYYILLVLFSLVLAVEVHFCFSVIFKIEKPETSYINKPNESEDNDDGDKEEKNDRLDGYLKTLNHDEYVYKERKIDVNHVIVGEEIRNDKEYIRNYKIIMNGKTTDMVVSYILGDDGEIKGTLKYGDKTLNLDVYDISSYVDNKSNLLKIYIEDFNDNMFQPEYLEFFKGDDGKDYVILDIQYRSEYTLDVASYIFNDSFDKLKATFNGIEVERFIRYNDYARYVRLDEYRNSIGYLAKKFVGGEDAFLNMALINGKVRYLYVEEGERASCNNNKFSQIIEYEFSVRNNKISLRALDTEKVFWDKVGC